MAEVREPLTERIKKYLFFKILWIIATALVASVRYKIDGKENFDKLIKDGKGGLILTWHGETILPIYYCRYRGFYSIVSLSKDGELQNKLLKSRGFNTIRGSNARQGIRALLEAVRRLKEGKIIAITPDGPKGPTKKVQPGTVHMAMRSGVPVLPVGVACKPAKHLKSWDSHLIPMPFSKAVISFGSPLIIAEDEDETAAAERIEHVINESDRRALAILLGERHLGNA